MASYNNNLGYNNMIPPPNTMPAVGQATSGYGGYPPPAYGGYPAPGYGGPTPAYGGPTPAYGGYPMYGGIPPGMNYEQMMAYRSNLIQQRRQYMEKMLKENFPVKYVIVHSCLLIAICIISIVMQIMLIINKSGNYTVGSGIWVAAYFLFTVGLALLLTKNRNYCLHIIVLIMHFFGIMFGFGGLLLVNVISLTSYSFDCNTSYSSFYSYSWSGKTTTTANPNNCQLSPYSIVLIVFGALLLPICITYVVVMQCTLAGGCRKVPIQQVSNNPNGILQPNNLTDSNMPRVIY